MASKGEVSSRQGQGLGQGIAPVRAGWTGALHLGERIWGWTTTTIQPVRVGADAWLHGMGAACRGARIRFRSVGL